MEVKSHLGFQRHLQMTFFFEGWVLLLFIYHTTLIEVDISSIEVLICFMCVNDSWWGNPSHNVNVWMVEWSLKKASLGSLFLHIIPIEVRSHSFEVEGTYVGWIIPITLLLVRNIPPNRGTWIL